MTHFPPPALHPAFWVRRDLRIDWPEVARNTRQVTPVTVLCGRSGVGKSQLAAEYAHRRTAEGWPLVLWLSAANETSLLADLDRVAESFGAWDARSDVSRTVPAGLAMLREHPGPVLMVYDDAPDLDLVRRWMPRFGAVHVVVATRAAVPDAIEIGGYAPAEVPPDLADLAARLDHHPAALAVAASTIGPGRRFPTPGDHPATDVVRLAHESLPADVHGLLERLSVLAPTGAALRLLGWKQPPDVPPALATVADGRITLTNWVRCAIADRSRHDTVLTDVTDALQKAVRRLDPRSRAAVVELALHLSAVYLHSAGADVAIRRRLLHLRVKTADALLRTCNTTAVDALGPAILVDATALYGNIAHGDLVKMHFNLRQARDALGYPADTLRAAHDQVATAAQLHGARHPVTLAHRLMLGRVHRGHGTLEDAFAVLAPVLHECRTVLGPDHADTLWAAHLLGITHLNLGQLDEAAAALEGTYADRRRVFGAGHAETAYSGTALAIVHLETGHLDEGMRLLEQVLADHLAARPDPAALANVRHDLADTYRMVGRTAEAKALYRQCLAHYDRHHKGGVAALNALGGQAVLGG
ncbi:tetratricopeptide repeat protein [Dactylosporangium cerinum]|uniref:Tetratricopeptide repeat protein n=1 Tax=Dactylosporangium cerinum TaxID=1434730 RepID=A0ABV9WBH1_9ACTN